MLEQLDSYDDFFPIYNQQKLWLQNVINILNIKLNFGRLCLSNVAYVSKKLSLTYNLFETFC